MLKVYVCEDNLPMQKKIVDIIQKTIAMEEYNMVFTLATDNPYKVLETLANDPSPGFYVLDVNLPSDNFDGIQLAAEIRNLDPRGFIIFITAEAEKLNMTFEYKVEAMDYITKDNYSKARDSLIRCLGRANELYMAQTNTVHRFFRFKVGSTIVTLPMDTVVYFESSKTVHRVIVHTTEGITEFYGTLKELEEQAKGRFLRSHRGYLVNTEYITSVDFTALTIHFHNGESCPISARLSRQFK